MYSFRTCFGVIVFLGTLVCDSQGVERLDIDVRRDPQFLPFELKVHDRADYSDRESTFNIARVARLCTGDSATALFSTTSNPEIGADAFAQLCINAFPQRSIPSDSPIRLTVRHHAPFYYPGSTEPAYLGGGTRNDSAFVFLARPDSATEYLFLASGTDISGNGEWSADVLVVLVADIDFDGALEAIIKINPYRDNVPTRLYCLTLDDLRIRWQLDYFLYVGPTEILVSNDSSHPGIIISTVGSGHGLTDSLTNDQFGNLTFINPHGVVTANKVVNYFGNGGALAYGFAPGTILLGHSLPFLSPHNLPDSVDLRPMLSIVNMEGIATKTVPVPSMVRCIVVGDFTGENRTEILAVTADYSVLVLDTSLSIVAESRECGVHYVSGVLPTIDGHGRALVFSVPEGVMIVNERLEALGFATERMNYFEPLKIDSDGRLTSVLASSRRQFVTLNIVPRSFADYVMVFYIKYRNYILVGLSSLFIGLLVTNYYRGRVSRQKRALQAAHAELAETHRALKEAQAQIVAQEKYRQAQDIAGGFAHEIRNALLPAEIALDRSLTVSRQQPTDSDRIAGYLKSVSTAVARAIGITELISQYTKLDSHYLPEGVALHDVLAKVIEANRPQIDKLNVTVELVGPTDVVVDGNTVQLEIAFTNLLLNSLDALGGRQTPAIRITTRVDHNRAIVEFYDNGSGIAPENLARVFETFFSTKPNKGTGLGLPTTRKIIELYGGSITARSTPGIETCITVTLNVKNRTQAGARPDTARGHHPYA